MKILLRVLISLGFLGLLFYLMRGDIPQIVSTLRNVNRPMAIAMVLLFLSTVLILALRLKLIFAVEDIKINLTETSSLTFVGYFFNNFLPTSVGGDIVKALCASRVTGSPVKSVTSVLMDRIFGLFTFICIPSISLLFIVKTMENSAVPTLVYSCLAVAVFCFFLIFNKSVAKPFKFIQTFLNRFRMGEKIRQVYEGLHNFKNHKAVVLQAMLLSLVGQSIGIFVLYGFALALGSRAPAIYFYLLVPVVHLISMLPSLNGLGIREGAYIYFLTPYIGKEYAAALGILWLGLLFLLSIIGGVIYLCRHDYHIRFKTAAASIPS